MKRTLSTLLVLMAALIFWVPTGYAQVTLSTTNSSPAFSLTNSTFPNLVFPTATITGTGTAKFNLGGIAGASVRITGTYSSLTAQIKASNDNVNFDPIVLVPITPGLVGGLTLTGASTASNGLYYVSLAGITQVQISVTAFTGTSTTIRIVGSAVDYPKQTIPADPCQDSNIIKQSAVVNVGAATTAVLVPVAAGKNTYVCDVQGTLAGTTPTLVLKAGTQVTNPCDTGAVALTGTMAPTSGVQLFFGFGGSVFGPPQVPIANQICGTTTGAGSSFQGSISFVQI